MLFDSSVDETNAVDSTMDEDGEVSILILAVVVFLSVAIGGAVTLYRLAGGI